MNLKETREAFRSGLSGIYSLRETDSIFYILLEHFGGISKVRAMAEPGFHPDEKLRLEMMNALDELKGFKPVQYITGKTVFCGLDLKLTNDVLIPRPETEELVHWIIAENKINTGLKILDVGTGSGCVAIALKSTFKQAEVFAMDISERALRVAKKNAEHNNLQVSFIMEDILHPASKLPVFDIIVSNPPYVTRSELAQMQRNVLDYEPGLALFVENEDPFRFYDAIFEFALEHSAKDGIIYFEINQHLAEPLAIQLAKRGMKKVELKRDINGNYRFLKGCV